MLKLFERGRRALIALLVVNLMTMNIACTRFVSVPAAEYERAQEDSVTHWRVQTKDGSTYAVARFSVTDSTFVIEEFDRGEESPGSITDVLVGVPLVINLNDVSSVKKKVYVEKSETALVTGLLVVVGVALLIYLSIYLSLEGLE